MPIDPASAGALASAGGSAFSNMFNVGATLITNKKNRQFSEHMYDRQRADAIADRDFMNHYNSPEEQMKRLVAAGLNPNLVYGHGADASNSAMPRQSSPGPTPNQAPQIELSGLSRAVSEFVNITKTMAETDRIKEMVELYKTQQVLNMTNVGKAKADTEQIYQNIAFKDQINPLNLEQIKANITNTDTRTFYMLREDARKELMNNANLSVAFQKVKNMIAEQGKTEAQRKLILQNINNAEKDGTLKQLDINLKKLGIQPGDELWQRAIAQALGQFMNGTSSENIVKGFTGENVIIPKGSQFDKLFTIFP